LMIQSMLFTSAVALKHGSTLTVFASCPVGQVIQNITCPEVKWTCPNADHQFSSPNIGKTSSTELVKGRGH